MAHALPSDALNDGVVFRRLVLPDLHFVRSVRVLPFVDYPARATGDVLARGGDPDPPALLPGDLDVVCCMDDEEVETFVRVSGVRVVFGNVGVYSRQTCHSSGGVPAVDNVALRPVVCPRVVG